MWDFLISTLFGFWILGCILLLPRATSRPWVGATVAMVSGLLVLLALRQLGYGGLIAGDWAMYIPIVLLVAATIGRRVRRARRQGMHDGAA